LYLRRRRWGKEGGIEADSRTGEGRAVVTEEAEVVDTEDECREILVCEDVCTFIWYIDKQYHL
jgi:hypothetical protein